MDLTDRIEELLTPLAEDMTLDIVRIRFSGEGRTRALQIMLDRSDDARIKIEDCSRFSRDASALLDVEDWIQEAYNLEVSSAGMDRPLTKFKDYVRFTGSHARVELHDPQDNQKRFKGVIKSTDAENETITFTAENSEDADVLLDYSAIYRGKLIVTDEMIRNVQRASKKKT